jgi:hypothetical protein
MGDAVYFDDNPSFRAEGIDNVATNRGLPTELQSVERAMSQGSP